MIMDYFRKTTHLSEILEESNKNPVIIFKYSRECSSSFRLEEKLEKYMRENLKNDNVILYKITVQTEPVLSNKIADWFKIKHESPQILILNKAKIVYHASHDNIKTENFAFN